MSLFLARIAQAHRVTGGSGDPHWSNVQSLLHMDGADGGSTFFDSAASANWLNNSVVTKTSTKKFGSSSGLFVASNVSRLAKPPSAPLIGKFGTDDFTIEGFLYLNSLPISMNRYGFAITNDNAAASSRGWQININGDTGGRLDFRVYPGGTTQYESIVRTTSPLAIGKWYYIAMCRIGATLYGFLDGILVGTVPILGTSSMTIGDAAPGTLIGTINGGQPVWAFDGYIDEVRITRGVGRYAATFTPPSSPFPDY